MSEAKFARAMCAALIALALALGASLTPREAPKAAPEPSATTLAYLRNTCRGNADEAERCAQMYPQLRSVFYAAVG